MFKNKYLHYLVGVALSAGAGLSVAQNYPTKPIRLIVAFAPGGATDTFARITAAEITRNIGQQVIVENQVGGGRLHAAAYRLVDARHHAVALHQACLQSCARSGGGSAGVGFAADHGGTPLAGR